MTGQFGADKETELKAFWPSNEPIRKLAQKWNCSDAYISQRAKALGLPSRVNRTAAIRQAVYMERFDGKVDNFRYLELEAIKRGMNVAGLMNRIVMVVADARLVDAVLDDGVEPRVSA